MNKTKAPVGKPEGRLFYEMIETSPGSKSQGWHGVLYGKDGKPVELVPGKSFDTAKETGSLPCGKFVGVKHGYAWDPYGAIPEVLITAHGAENHIMREKWTYRLYVSAEGTRHAATLGELRLEGRIVDHDPGHQEIMTAMGPFVWKANAQPFGPHGWYPQHA
jgi:hypothetical protein